MNNLVLPEWVVGFFWALAIGAPAIIVLIFGKKKKKIFYFVLGAISICLGSYLVVTYNIFAVAPMTLAIIVIGCKGNKEDKLGAT